VKIDDNEVVDLYPYIKSVEVKMSRKSASTCTILIDSIRDESGDWLVQDREDMVPWKKLTIEAQFADYKEEVMRGYIRDVKVKNPQDMSASVVAVTGQDDSILFDREHIRKTWSREDEQVSDGDIASEIAIDRGLSADVEDGLTNTSLQQDETSIRFLKKRADANGYELFFREGILNFYAPRLGEEPQATIMVYAGPSTNCLSFEANYDGHSPDQIEVVRAPATGTDVDPEIVTPDLVLLGNKAADSQQRGLPTFQWAMNQPRGATQTEANARAQATANENAWKINATGELDGSLYGHVLLTHKTVEVDGVGSTWGGKYYVDEVTHVFSLEGYRQRFKLLRNATGQQI
jgi:phage protein D